jgi:hypothetical protein
LGKVFTINSSAPQTEFTLTGMSDYTTIFAAVKAEILRKTKYWIATLKYGFDLLVVMGLIVGRDYRFKSFPTIRKYLKEIIRHRISLLKTS